MFNLYVLEGPGMKSRVTYYTIISVTAIIVICVPLALVQISIVQPGNYYYNSWNEIILLIVSFLVLSPGAMHIMIHLMRFVVQKYPYPAFGPFDRKLTFKDHVLALPMITTTLLFQCITVLVYIMVSVNLYRTASDIGKVMFCLVIHPIIIEFVLLGPVKTGGG
jgi:hypothetical protein